MHQVRLYKTLRVRESESEHTALALLPDGSDSGGSSGSASSCGSSCSLAEQPPLYEVWLILGAGSGL